MSEFRTENLGKGFKICVSDSHGFGTDAVLLADFASPGSGDAACDLCAGCGIVTVLWRRNGRGGRITAVELMPEACELAQRSFELNGLGADTGVINCDLRQIASVLPHGCMDVVAVNPPYKAKGSGVVSGSPSASAARHETMCSLSDVCAAAAHLLRFRGRLCMCNRPERLADAFEEMRLHGIEPKRLRFVSKSPGSKPWLFLLEGTKGGRPFLNVEPELMMYSREGVYSSEVREIYGDCGKEN